MDHIEVLIKKLASQGKNRNDVVRELTHAGYNAEDIERSLNSMHAQKEVPESFWDKGATYAQDEILQPATLHARQVLKKIILWAGVILVCIVGGYFAWVWYDHQPAHVMERMYEKISQAHSFAFSISVKEEESSRIDIQGVAVLKNQVGISAQITGPILEKQNTTLSILQKKDERLLFKIENHPILGSYGWISSSHDVFFNEAERFGIKQVIQYLDILKNFNQERADKLVYALERVALSSAQKNKRGIVVGAEQVYKRHVVQLASGLGDRVFMDRITNAEWIIQEVKRGKEFTLVINGGDMIVRIGNINMFLSIPFDSIATPLEDILRWGSKKDI